MPDTTSALKKRLALFLDGTWNQVSDNTNIWRFRALFASVSADGREQRAYYSTGLGTKFGERIRGGMFGTGIDTAITSAYEWLIENYAPGDDIFIFGFSRGAYTARSLSGFVSKCGLLQSGAPLGVNQLYKRYRRPRQRTIRELIAARDEGTTDFSFEEGWMVKYAQAVPIKFLGVFDTVGALGVPFPLLQQIRGSAYPFLNTGLRQNNEYAFHALAIDEHRKAFAPTLWSNEGATNAKPRPIERTEQRWFVGAHANVGGGCFDDPLASLPFKWLERKANALGLAFRDGFEVDPNAIAGKVSDSYGEFMGGLYRLFTFDRAYYRPIGAPPRDEGPGVVNINETIDASVFERWRNDPTYRPPALEAWAKAKKVDLAKIASTVRADDPATAVPN
ncbi:DUF2235 domain-containing protein [Bradyrhizobium lablabi]|uniref:DUF2235 domain-containing protein n=1 Tax=Bradyrhizobium lablabi TaxID=722472 RepID=UPI001BA815D2|nr:DUF2235 domain-containing protein [Bradyrhizobium lablabi]MBR0694816.1 DUF2235 domain-containing protein [Bradyrhizobium lablabi]